MAYRSSFPLVDVFTSHYKSAVSFPSYAVNGFSFSFWIYLLRCWVLLEIDLSFASSSAFALPVIALCAGTQFKLNSLDSPSSMRRTYWRIDTVSEPISQRGRALSAVWMSTAMMNFFPVICVFRVIWQHYLLAAPPLEKSDAANL